MSVLKLDIFIFLRKTDTYRPVHRIQYPYFASCYPELQENCFLI
jgi:hypothetical protein